MPINPLVSIIIPVFNEEKYLAYCLDSLKKQTYKNKEIIVVDDGSTDKSIQIAKKFTDHVYVQLHCGPGAARNLGVAKSQGSILIFIDADMKLDKDCIEKLIQPIQKTQAIGTFIKDERVANPENMWSQCWSINANLPYDKRLPDNHPELANGFRAIIKSEFVYVGGFDTNVGYTDDDTLHKKIHVQAVNAHGAIAYHFNPSTLLEVYYSTRWIGRSRLFPASIINLLRYSILNSLRLGILQLIKHAPYQYSLFKIVYDFGIFTGIFISGQKTDK